MVLHYFRLAHQEVIFGLDYLLDPVQIVKPSKDRYRKSRSSHILEHSPSWQTSPCHPAMHLHVNWSIPSAHVPLFKQGEEAHSSTSGEKRISQSVSHKTFRRWFQFFVKTSLTRYFNSVVGNKEPWKLPIFFDFLDFKTVHKNSWFSSFPRCRVFIMTGRKTFC